MRVSANGASRGDLRPFVAGVGADGTDMSALDVFPKTLSIQPHVKVHLPDYDLIVSYGAPVNGAAGPVVIFGDATGQMLGLPSTADLETIHPKQGVKILNEWVAVEWTNPQRKAVHSYVQSQGPWADLLDETIAASEAAHWKEVGCLRANRIVEFTEDGRYSRPEEISVEDVTQLSLTPLFELSDGTVVAALSQTAEGHPLLLLPKWTPNVRAWLRLAWQTWVDQGAMDVPPPPDGYEESAWMTADEFHAHTQIEDTKDELATVRDRLESHIHTLEDQLQAATSAAEAGLRRLLTGTGDALVEAVHRAFELCGFEVTDMDKVLQDKREDLRVRNGDSWTALVEVKGYTGGGKTNDFFRFGKFQTYYGQEPDHTEMACWYVVNSYRHQAPSARPGPFRSSQADVIAFADNFDGLVIPTEELFKLVRDVDLGAVTSKEARALLVGATGTYIWTPTANEDSLDMSGKSLSGQSGL